jgi:hypothetical protein
MKLQGRDLLQLENKLPSSPICEEGVLGDAQVFHKIAFTKNN